MMNRQREHLLRSGEFTSMPNVFFTHIMPKIQDIAELKVTLCIFYLLNHKHRYPRFVTRGELLFLSALMGMEEETLHHALSLAVEHGTFLRGTVNIDDKPEEAYFINTESDKETSKARENIFALYEQNIGIITPMIAEELEEAERLYPPQWIDEAFKEAVTMNKRSWKYIARILERWASEGKESGEYRKSTKEGGPDKYIHGKYGHLVKR